MEKNIIDKIKISINYKCSFCDMDSAGEHNPLCPCHPDNCRRNDFIYIPEENLIYSVRC
jgi:hypothetical protein